MGRVLLSRPARGGWKLVDDRDLAHVHPPRSDTIGARSAPYGPARVHVRDASGQLVASVRTDTTNWCHVTGLSPDTVYSYEVIVNDEVWAEGDRDDWRQGAEQGLARKRARTSTASAPIPRSIAIPRRAPISFAVIGYFGVGIRWWESPTKRQAAIAAALTRAVEHARRPLRPDDRRQRLRRPPSPRSADRRSRRRRR